MMAGINYASGDVIVSIDSDLQNDPADIPRLLKKLDEGYDVVSGWRQDRKDAAITRNFVSRGRKIALISWISGVSLHDYGCTLKAYRRDVIEGVKLYGEMHRFIPIYAKAEGARIAEIAVNHRPRRFGSSKYGLERTLKVILDLLVISFLDRYFSKPIYVFGGFGAASMIAAIGCLFWMLYLKIVEGISMILTPLPHAVSHAFLNWDYGHPDGAAGGILVRVYFESQSRPAYNVQSVLNMTSAKG